MQTLRYVIDAAGHNKRLDVFLSEAQAEISRSRLKKLIEEELVSVNGSPARAKQKLKKGDRIELRIPPPVALQAVPERF